MCAPDDKCQRITNIQRGCRTRRTKVVKPSGVVTASEADTPKGCVADDRHGNTLCSMWPCLRQKDIMDEADPAYRVSRKETVTEKLGTARTNSKAGSTQKTHFLRSSTKQNAARKKALSETNWLRPLRKKALMGA